MFIKLGLKIYFNIFKLKILNGGDSNFLFASVGNPAIHESLIDR